MKGKKEILESMIITKTLQGRFLVIVLSLNPSFDLSRNDQNGQLN